MVAILLDESQSIKHRFLYSVSDVCAAESSSFFYRRIFYILESKLGWG